MRSVFYFAANAVCFVFTILFSNANARSLLKAVSDSTTYQSNKHHASEDFMTRRRRDVDGACPVRPNIPVILNGKETYFDFDASQPAPAPLPGENEKMSCPKSEVGDWWPGLTSNLKASCPWKWVTYDTWTIVDAPFEIYPRYVTQAECLCTNCVNAGTMGCKKLQREYQFYLKTHCDDNKPVFMASKMEVTVGCYCEKS